MILATAISKKYRNLIEAFIVFVFIGYFTSCNSPSQIKNEILRKTVEWNNLNNNYNGAWMKSLFAERVTGYTKSMTQSEFLELKYHFITKSEDFTQSITSDLSITVYKGDLVKCAFTKKASLNGKAKSYPSYLIFSKIEGEYLIIEEGDDITNFNLGYRPILPEATNEFMVPMNEIRAGANWLMILGVGGALVLGLVVVIWMYRLMNKPKEKPPITQTGHSNSESVILTTEVKTSTALNLAPDSLPSQNSPTPKEKGDAFEKYILRYFEEDYFKIIHWTGDKGVDGRYAESNMDPDLILQLNTLSTSTMLAVECKYRSRINRENQIEICSSDQFSRYKQFAKREKMDVFIAFGTGGTADAPEEVYVLPLKKLYQPKIGIDTLMKYKKKPDTRFFYDAFRGTLT